LAKKTSDLTAGGVHPGQFLKNDVQYRAPIFQRHYVWKGEQFETLWQDITLLLEVGGEVESRFLGALVLEDQGGGLSTDPDEYLIVDGQQRLLTLQLVLAAIAAEADALGTPEAKTFAAQNAKLWLVNQSTRIAEQLKVLPTLEDYAQFVAVMNAVRPFATLSLPTPYGQPKGHLTKMFQLIRKTVRESAEAAAATLGTAATADERMAAKLAHLETLASTVLNKLKFVQIVLGSDDDPHHVFDRLNDAGIKLDVADLIRNDVFLRLAADPKVAQNLHDMDWVPFEKSLAGKLPDFVFPYALIKKSSTTKGRMMPDLREAWKGWDSSAIIADLKGYVPSFMALADGQVSSTMLPKGAGGLKAQIERLARMPVPSSVYPYAMMAIKTAVEDPSRAAEVERCLLLIEAFLVRRALHGVEPTGLHALFKGMWAKVGADPIALIADIDSKPTIQFPTDGEFASDILSEPLYGKRIVYYVLDEYDRSLRGDAALVKPTVDHLMPQKLGAGWTVPASEHQRLLHVWANLVPLSNAGNAGKGNEPWADVVTRVLKETSFKSARDVVLNYSTWGPVEIEARGADLVTWALTRWPRK
jgi:hypothetical protein